MLEAPDEHRVRRALKRAERGVSLDPSEAEVLLHARGDLLEGCCGRPVRSAMPGSPPPGAPAS